VDEEDQVATGGTSIPFVNSAQAGASRLAYTRSMPNNLSRFSIHCDDVSRARRFYQAAFGWRFEPWGPPDFYLITTGSDADPGVGGLMQKRQQPVAGKGMIGFECTIGVEDIDQALHAVEANGGILAMPKFKIPTVGTGFYFNDTEGNLVGAMQYEKP
jgi:predicted enzyme related to lactoylglutathione lyase